MGNKVLFAGGVAGICGAWSRTSTVDIYDLVTNSWSTTFLSGAKGSGQAAVTVNNKVYFSGGTGWPGNVQVPGNYYASNTIDIYDNATNAWSTSSLTEGKLGHAGVAVNDKIFWAGGWTGSYPTTGSCSVEIHNVNTGNKSIQTLSGPWSPEGCYEKQSNNFFC